MSDMLAARTIAAGTLSFDRMPEPVRQSGQCLVRVDAVSLCGTDLHIYHDDYPTDLPLVQGHEICATVVEADPGSRLHAGDRVVVDPLVSCGVCPVCRGGHANVCPQLSVIGGYSDGGLTERLVVPDTRLHRVPGGLASEVAALAEPTSIALQAVGRAQARPGDTALVLGCGPIGLLATLGLSDQGVTVVCADIDPQRAALAAGFGADDALVVGPAFPDAVQREILAGLSDGAGPRIIVEATGAPSSLENAVRLIAPAGRIVQVGISQAAAALTVKDLTDKEIELVGSRNSRGLIPAALDLLQRHRDAATALITHRFELTELGEAFRIMADRRVPTGKIVIRVSREQELAA